MQEDWPDRQVERRFTLPKGWTQVALSYEHKVAVHYWSPGGDRTRWRNNTRWDYSTLNLRLSHGFSKHLRMDLDLPVMVRAQLRNALGTNTVTSGMGDARVALTAQPWLAETWHVAYTLHVDTPSGVEWPGDYVGGPASTSSFLTGTGSTGVGLTAHHRLVAARLFSAELSLGWTFRLPGVVGYVLEDGGFGNGWLDPGDVLDGHIALGLQLGGDVAWHMDGWVSHRTPYRIGTSGSSVLRANLDPIPDSAGTYVDTGTRLSWEPLQNLELGAMARVALLGADTTRFGPLGLEAFAPQPGWTFGGTVTGRW